MDAGPSVNKQWGTFAGVGFAAVVAALWWYWPAGVALGLVFGVVATILIGRAVEAAAASEPHDGRLETMGEDELWQDFRRLRVRLGDDWPDFASAVMLVTRAQWASAAGLQRDLHVSAARAEHLVALLEGEGFVGPVRGTRPRDVLVDREKVPELRRLLHA